MQLFNKVDKIKAQSFYNEDDVKIATSLGKLFGEILKTHREYMELAKHNRGLIDLVEEHTQAWKAANKISRREKLHIKLIEMLKSQPILNKKLMKMIKNVMDCSHASLFLSGSSSTKPFLTSGTYENPERIAKLIEYSCYSKQKILNIRDLSVEPLIDTEIPSNMSTGLILPFNLKNSETKVILCLLRDSKEFSKVDQTFAENIVKELAEYPTLYENSKFRIQILDIDSEIKYLNKYSLPEDIDFDFYEFFYSVKVKLGELFKLSSCSIYIANQNREQLWTRNSSSSSSLLFPHNSETLLGRTYEYGEIINLPNKNYFMLSDLEVFEDKFVISLPISNANYKDPVIGVLLCTRKDQDFSEFEAWLIEKYAENLAEIFDQIFLSYLTTFDIENESSSRCSLVKSPNSMFREINKERFTFMPEDLPLEEKDDDVLVFETSLALSEITVEQFIKMQAVLKEVRESMNPLKFYEKISELGGCEKAECFMMCDFGRKLQNVVTKNYAPISALVKMCMEHKELLYIEDDEFILPEDGFGMDGMNTMSYYKDDKSEKSEGKNLVLIPVLNRFKSLVGILKFENFPHRLEKEEIDNLKTISLIAWLMCLDFESRNWNEIIDEMRGQYALQQWSSYLIQVANMSISKMLLCKNAIHKLVNCNDIREIMKICIEVVCTVMDCNWAEIIIEVEESICQINSFGYKYIDLTSQEYAEFKKISSYEKIRKEYTSDTFTLWAPIVYNELKGYLKIENNNNQNSDLNNNFSSQEHLDTLSQNFKFSKRNNIITSQEKRFEDFRLDNEAILIELCERIGEAAYNFPDTLEQTLNSLIQSIKMMALQYKPLALNLVINSAAKNLVDGERASFFAYKDKKLIVQDQGIEYEIPRNFALTNGKGIAWHIFNNGKAEIVHDAYSDERFDPVVDKLTGYKTTSVVCIPLVTNFEKLGVLEVLNKRNGKFTSKNLKLLEKFGDLVCMVLEIMGTMQITLEERFRLLAISNTMEQYILVFNENRNLIYLNKPIDRIFGVSQEHIMNLTYFAWMHGNKGLMEDLQAVFENSSLHIRKTSQKIKNKKSSSIRGSLRDQNVKSINYRVCHLKNFSADCSSGVILIIEDATALELLHNEFKEVQKEIRIIASPIGTETKLQKCIRELSVIISHIDNPEMKESLSEVISQLKGGGLKKPKLLIESDEYNVGAITSILGMPQGEKKHRNPSVIETPKFIIEIQSEISLSTLRDWDINTFKIENPFEWVYSMLKDFDLIQRFQVDHNVLYNFTARIKEKSNHWNNPFHNFYHCFNVMHGVYMMLTNTPAGSYFDDLQIYSLLIAALCHDVDHRGRGNMFEVHSRSVIATTYHDKSVLEQHHASVAFFTLQEEGCNIFSSLNRENFNKARKLIITSILGTDMSKHLVMLENMAARFKDINEKAIGTLDKDMEKLAQLILHAGDLCHPCKSFRIYELWSMLVCQEFSDQYKEEVKLGLPITEFMKNLEMPKVYYANEVGFLSFVVKPLWECVNLFLSPHIDVLVHRLGVNIETMKCKLEEWKKAES